MRKENEKNNIKQHTAIVVREELVALGAELLIAMAEVSFLLSATARSLSLSRLYSPSLFRISC